MDHDIIQKAEEEARNWLADDKHRKCCKMALEAVQTITLIGLTAGVAMLCLLKMRKCHRCNCHCTKTPTES